MRVAGRADVDDVDVLALDDRTPVAGRLGEAELRGGSADARLRSPAYDGQLDIGRQLEEAAHLAPRVRMRAAHELVADHRDAELSLAHVERQLR
jgi:hypothetical protein